MKKLDILVLKSFLGPLLFTFSISEFVLLLQFLWKTLEKVIGKGLDTFLILQLIWYIMVTLVPMALPLAVLLASIMTMGNFGEKYELVAMKSAGISLWRVLRPLIVLVSILSIFAFFFSNNFMPIAEKKMRTLMYEINTKKPTINIRPNEFYSYIENYVIRVGSKDKEGKNLSDILIFDHSKGMGNTNITFAKRGQMYSEDNGNTLVFNLKDGYTYDESVDEESRLTLPLIRMNFKEEIMRFDVSDFAFQETDKDRYSNHYKMLSISKLNENIKELRKEKQDFNNSILNNAKLLLNPLSLKARSNNPKDSTLSFYGDYAQLNKKEKEDIRIAVKQKIHYIQSDIKMLSFKKDGEGELIIRNNNEWHRKFTLSAACIILFFIGAPLGAIIRKGGLGMPVVLSVLCFILYYVVGMIGEKAAVEGALSSFFGMWSATLVFLPIGLFLTIKATSDSAIMNPEGWEKIFRKIFTKIKNKDIKNEDTTILL